MQPNHTRVLVYELPPLISLSNGYCFGGPVPVQFGNVDWFNGFDGMTEDMLRAEVERKLYIRPGRTYLVLSPENDMAFYVKNTKPTSAGQG